MGSDDGGGGGWGRGVHHAHSTLTTAWREGVRGGGGEGER